MHFGVTFYSLNSNGIQSSKSKFVWIEISLQYTYLILWAIRFQIKCIAAHKHLHLWDTREGPFPFRTFVNGAAKCISLLLSYCYWFCNLVMLYPSQEDNGSVNCATHILYNNLVLCNLSDTKDNHTRYCFCKILILLHGNSKKNIRLRNSCITWMASNDHKTTDLDGFSSQVQILTLVSQ